MLNLNQRYPGLEFIMANSRIYYRGDISFFAAYSPATKNFIINPESTANIPINYVISDSYKVEIEFHIYSPSIREVGGRTESILKRKRIPKIDLHLFKGGTICLCPYPEFRRLFPEKVNIIKYIDGLVIPYFYSLSFYEKYNYWPLGQYSHGDSGIYEYYLKKRNHNNKSLISLCIESLKTPGKEYFFSNLKNMNENQRCICGKNRRFKDCHEEAFQGLTYLLQDYKLTQNQ